MLGFGSHFLAVEPGLSRVAAISYFGAVVASLWTIGGVAEGRFRFVRLEALRLAVGAALAFGLGVAVRGVRRWRP